MISTLQLLKERKFLPLFLTQMLGALNDNILRSSIIIFISYKLADTPEYANFWTHMATTSFMLPTLLFSTISGELADKYKKIYLLRGTKLFEIPIVLLTSYLLLTTQTPALLVFCIFLMGAHAAIFSPAKFSYMPEYLEDEELLPANSLIEGSSFVAIAAGAGISTLIDHPNYGVQLITSLLIPIAIIGWLCSTMIPPNQAQNPDLMVHKNIFTSTQKLIDTCTSDPAIWLPIIGISWFWVIGYIYLNNLSNFVKFELHYASTVVGLLNATFTIGIAIGSFAANKVLRGKINARFVPLSLFSVALFSFHLCSGHYHIPEKLGSLSDFLSNIGNYRIIIDMLCISISAGIYVVPLYTILQKNSPLEKCAQIIAASNIINSLFMISTGILSLFLLAKLHLAVRQLFFITAILNIGLSMYLLKTLPFSSVKPFFARIFKWFFKVEVQGIENFKNASNRLVIVANHVSFLDVLFLALFLPREYVYAVDTEISKKWYVRLTKNFVEAYPVDTSNPMKMKKIVKSISSGKPCIIFPEGRLSNTGSIMKVFDGAAMLAELSDADIMTVHIRGLKHSIFSRLQGIYKLRLRTQVKITILPVFRFKNANHEAS